MNKSRVVFLLLCWFTISIIAVQGQDNTLSERYEDDVVSFNYPPIWEVNSVFWTPDFREYILNPTGDSSSLDAIQMNLSIKVGGNTYIEFCDAIRITLSEVVELMNAQNISTFDTTINGHPALTLSEQSANLRKTLTIINVGYGLITVEYSTPVEVLISQDQFIDQIIGSIEYRTYNYFGNCPTISVSPDRRIEHVVDGNSVILSQIARNSIIEVLAPKDWYVIYFNRRDMIIVSDEYLDNSITFFYMTDEDEEQYCINRHDPIDEIIQTIGEHLRNNRYIVENITSSKIGEYDTRQMLTRNPDDEYLLWSVIETDHGKVGAILKSPEDLLEDFKLILNDIIASIDFDPQPALELFDTQYEVCEMFSNDSNEVSFSYPRDWVVSEIGSEFYLLPDPETIHEDIYNNVRDVVITIHLMNDDVSQQIGIDPYESPAVALEMLSAYLQNTGFMIENISINDDLNYELVTLELVNDDQTHLYYAWTRHQNNELIDLLMLVSLKAPTEQVDRIKHIMPQFIDSVSYNPTVAPERSIRLSNTYISPSGFYEFDYPNGWRVDNPYSDAPDNATLYPTRENPYIEFEEDNVSFVFLTGSFLSRFTDGFTNETNIIQDAESLANVLPDMYYLSNPTIAIEPISQINSYDVVRISISEPNEKIMFRLAIISDNEFKLTVLLGLSQSLESQGLELFEAILESIEIR